MHKPLNLEICLINSINNLGALSSAGKQRCVPVPIRGPHYTKDQVSPTESARGYVQLPESDTLHEVRTGCLWLAHLCEDVPWNLVLQALASN